MALRGAPRLVRRVPSVDAQLRLLVEVETNLIVQFGISPGAAEESREPEQARLLQAGSMIRVIASTICPQRDRFAASCFLPAAVSR